MALTEAVLYRLIPDPSGLISSSIWSTIHASLNRAGSLTFFLAFFLLILALGNLGFRALRHPVWPSGVNGFLAVCLLCLVALGLSALVTERGSGFAILFTGVSLLTLLVVAMQAFLASGSAPIRTLAVLYGAAMICSAAATLSGLPGAALPAFLGGADFARATVRAGHLLVAGAAAAAFLGFAPWTRSGKGGFRSIWPAIGLGSIAASVFAGGCLLPPSRTALLGGEATPLTVITLSWVVFLGVVTVASNMTEPDRRMSAYGILLLLLAGFPLRIVHQQLMAVLGAVLVFAHQAPVPVTHDEGAPAGAPFRSLP